MTSRNGLDAQFWPGFATIATLALTNIAASADDQYPSKPVRIVVSFAAGGPTDTVARVIGAKLGELLGQQFFVENRAGAGGNLGADLVAKSRARRLHAADGDGVDPRHQSRPLQQDAVRSDPRFRRRSRRSA